MDAKLLLTNPRISQNPLVTRALGRLRHTLYETKNAVPTAHTCRDMIARLRSLGIDAWEPCFKDEEEDMHAKMLGTRAWNTQFIMVESGDETVVVKCWSGPKAVAELLKSVESLTAARLKACASAYAPSAFPGIGSAAQN